jgi:hypothetical protein
MSEFVKLPLWFNVVAFLLFSWPAFAEPMVKANVQGIEITVYTEDCALKNVVSNLPKRATWVEKGKTFEGCAGATQFGVLIFYFNDKTVAVVPVEHFAKVVGV